MKFSLSNISDNTQLFTLTTVLEHKQVTDMDSTIIIAPLYWAHHCGVGKILSTTGTKLALTIKAGATISTGLTTHMHLLCVLDQLCNSISGITMGWEKSMGQAGTKFTSNHNSQLFMLYGRLVHVGTVQLLTDLQILGCELHKSASGGMERGGDKREGTEGETV